MNEEKVAKAKELLKELKELELTEEEMQQINAAGQNTVDPRITDIVEAPAAMPGEGGTDHV